MSPTAEAAIHRSAAVAAALHPRSLAEATRTRIATAAMAALIPPLVGTSTEPFDNCISARAYAAVRYADALLAALDAPPVES